MLREYQTTYCTACAVQRSSGFSRYKYRVFPCQGACAVSPRGHPSRIAAVWLIGTGGMLLNVGEVLCGGMRLSVYVIGTPCAVNGWTCAVSLARLSRVRRSRSARSVGSLSLGMLASYHRSHELSRIFLMIRENIFDVSADAHFLRPARPSLPSGSPALSGRPAPACSIAARSCMTVCRLLTEHGIGGTFTP